MITLVNAPSQATTTMNVRVKNTQLTPHLGLLYMASSLEANGFKVEVLDAPAMNLGVEECVRHCRESELVGVSANTVSYRNARELIGRLNGLGVKTVVGGYHPTILPEFVMRDSKVDVLVVGEAEEAVVEIAGGRDPGGIRGIYYRDGSRIRKTGPRPLNRNLDGLPHPAWHLIKKPNNYGWLGKVFRISPSDEFGVIITSRGCPFKCSFCCASALYGHTYRQRSLESILDEINYLIGQGRRYIYVQDDNFCVNPEFVRAFCRAVKELDIEWYCLMRVDADASLYPVMRESGCESVYYGFESSSPRILRYFNKSISPERQVCAVKHARESNLISMASYVFGSPLEAWEDVRENLRVAVSSGVDFIEPNILTVFPGTLEWERQCSGMTPERGYSVEELGNTRVDGMVDWMMDSFYKRPGHLLRVSASILRHHNRIFRTNIGNVRQLINYIYKPEEREDICEGYPKRSDY